jgi:hypothetical protein
MKITTYLLSFIILFLNLSVAFSQTVTIEGHAFLENETVHDSIKLYLKRTAPSVLEDSIYTDSTGYFYKSIATGIYDITYSKTDFVNVSLTGQTYFSNTILQDTTLQSAGLYGPQTGILLSGTYVVGGDIEVPAGDTLIIQPGTRLLFKENIKFVVNGLLIAEGNVTDSIIFTTYINGQAWKGIKFNYNFLNTANQNCIISYAVVENSKEGAIWSWQGRQTYRNMTVKNCTGTPNGSYIEGGGFWLTWTDALIENCKILNNQAQKGGGIYYVINSNSGNDFKISNCEIYNNTANEGSGIYIQEGYYNSIHPMIINCTITNNTGSGSALYAAHNLPILVNNIVSYNNSHGIGTDWNHAIYLGYCNVSNNTLGNFANPPQWIGINITVNANGDSCDVYNNIQLDPQFVNRASHNYHLNANSPCIDAGLNDSVSAPIDLDDSLRIFDGNFDLDTIVDIGAYEFKTVITSVKPVDFPLENSNNYFPVYPNPNKGIFNILLYEASSLSIMDVNGKSILKRDFENSIENRLETVDLSSFAKGIYFLQVRGNKGVKTKMILIQ